MESIDVVKSEAPRDEVEGHDVRREERRMWTGFFEFGLVIVRDEAAIQYFNKNGMGSMRILHEGSTLKRAKGGRKSKGTDLDNIIDVSEENTSSQLKESDQTVHAGIASSSISFDLSLSEEEALYLVQKQELTVIDRTTAGTISLDSLYSTFTASRGCRLFALQYAVYSFFKDRNFVVKSGINFGMDYCIYRDSPEKVHSELCVRVVDAVSPSELTRIDAESDHPFRPEQLPYRNYHSNYCLVPPMPHPEGQHSAGGSEARTGTDASTGYYFDNLSWKTLSTITRVMPDVMKIGLLCYVLPKPWSPPVVATEIDSVPRPAVERYAHLFSIKPKESRSINATTELSWPGSPAEISERWEVRPVSVMVRRQIVNNTRYPLPKDLQQRYRAGAKIFVAAANTHEASDGNSKAKKKKFTRDRNAKSLSTDGEPAATAAVDVTKDDAKEQDPTTSIVAEDANSDMKGVDDAPEADEGEEDQHEAEETAQQDCSGAEVGMKRTREYHATDIIENEEIKEIGGVSTEREGEKQADNNGDVSKFTSNAFKRTRIRRNIEDVREKSVITKKATIWDLLSSPDPEDEEVNNCK